MSRYQKLITGSLLLSLVLAACAAPGTSTPTDDAARPGGAAQRVLAIANFGEPPQLAVKSLVTQGGALGIPSRFFNATFDIVDTREVTHPLIVEALPELNTESWKLKPDGTMETRYTLKPNLTWHDGTPLHAEDFVFAFRVYKTPELGQATSRPIGQMEEVLALDARTILIRWNQPYAEAHTLGVGFQGLPRHLLEEDFRSMDAVGFTNHPFWTIDYVGLGPYKLDRWEPGAFLTGSAFENFALGRPKIAQIRIAFINDPQTALANVLAGEIHYVGNFMFAVTHGVLLEEEWAQNRAGRVIYSPTQRRLGLIQMRPEDQQPRALSDVRVRYAVAHGLDHQSRVDALDGGKGQVAYTLTAPGVPYYAEIERAVLKHDYDPRRAEELMAQVGWTKGPNGFFVDGAGTRFTFQVTSTAGGKNEQEATLYVDSLRKVGFDAQQHVQSVAEQRDGEVRSRVSGLALRGAGQAFETHLSTGISGPANSWRGSNRGGWANPEYDQLFARLERTFTMNERVPLIAQMERILSVDRAITMNTWESLVNAFVAGLHGPEARQTPGSGGTEGFVHSWEWRE
jgi:peptide/nickel transport system substrate-binding protein